jgi:hypothetical protein
MGSVRKVCETGGKNVEKNSGGNCGKNVKNNNMKKCEKTMKRIV